MRFNMNTGKDWGVVVRDNETYEVRDYTLERMVASRTILYPGKCTGGHKHEGVEEVYYFINGMGEMQVGPGKIQVRGGDSVIIPDGAFHKVFNTGSGDLTFVAVFERYDR